MSKLLREYDAHIDTLLTIAKRDEMYVVARWHKRDFYAAIWRNHQLDENRIGQDTGLGLYVFTKTGHVAFGSTNELSDEAILKLYTELKHAAIKNEDLGIAKAHEIYDLNPQVNLGEDSLHYQHKPLLDYELDELPKILAGLDKRAVKACPDASFNGMGNIEQDQWRIVRSDGTDVDFSIPKVRLSARATIRTDDGSAESMYRGAGNSVEDLKAALAATDDHFEAGIKQAIEQAAAPSIKGGSPAVIMDAELIGMIAHEALGHPAESDIIAGGGSVLGDDNGRFKSGVTVADAGINVTDHEEGLIHGFHPYGAFGNARERVSIVKDGKLHESISDIFSAARIGVPNKNCERSESYSAPAIPRMSNTYVHIDNHQNMVEDDSVSKAVIAQRTLQANGMFKDHPTVLYIQGMSGGSVNPAGGTFMFGTQYAYEITTDSITPYKPVSFSGDALSALKSIRFGAGEIDTSDFGFCGKNSQSAHVNSGGNALVFLEPNESLTVA
jgi:TldD protein